MIREFFLSRKEGRDGLDHARFCDVVVLDLDASDGLFLVVEDKLFTSNHSGQLHDYFLTVHERYARSRIREFVYLTLSGRAPAAREDEESVLPHWIDLGWATDIHELLQEWSGTVHPDVERLRSRLLWLRHVLNLEGETRLTAAATTTLGVDLVRGASTCLVEELNRLCVRGRWTLASPVDRSTQIITHSSVPSRSLRVALLPTFSLTIQTWRDKRPTNEKRLVPFGAHPDQVFNLFDITARDLYSRMFTSPQTYLGTNRRLRTRVADIRSAWRPWFELAHRHTLALRTAMTLSKHVWSADQRVEEPVGSRLGESSPHPTPPHPKHPHVPPKSM